MMLSSQSRLLLTDLKRLHLTGGPDRLTSCFHQNHSPDKDWNAFCAQLVTADRNCEQVEILATGPERYLSDEEATEVCNIFKMWSLLPWPAGSN